MDSSPENAIRKPFIDHIHELRRRLVICVVFVIIGSGIGYALHTTLLRLIQQPLGEKLYFTSPTGGFNFIFVICISFGVLVALPCIIYQILAFLRPLLPHAKRAHMFWYPACSVFLAAVGVAFAYFISLPAALHFLTNFGGANIESLITTDAYFRFAMAYLLGFAVLFQLPLLLVISNRIKPLKPSKLMGAQRYVLVGSFIIAAILTPTPDPFNQLLMAGPIIILYQLSIILIWIINLKQSRKTKRKPRKLATTITPPTPSSLASAAVPLVAPRRLIVDVVGPHPRMVQRQPITQRASYDRPKTRPATYPTIVY